MFLMKLFGLLDLYSAVVMLLVQFDISPWRIVLTAAAWLLLKGFMFRGEFASMIDMGIAAYHIIMVVLPVPIVTYILAGYLVIKGVMSLAG